MISVKIGPKRMQKSQDAKMKLRTLANAEGCSVSQKI